MENFQIEEGFINAALKSSLEKSLENDTEVIYLSGESPFGRSNERNVNGELGFIAKGTKFQTNNKRFPINFKCEEKHVLVLMKTDIEWIRKMEKINLLYDESKIIWWFGKDNFNLRDNVLDLLGEFRTVQITDDIKPKVSFFIETKKRELFRDFEDQ